MIESGILQMSAELSGNYLPLIVSGILGKSPEIRCDAPPTIQMRNATGQLVTIAPDTTEVDYPDMVAVIPLNGMITMKNVMNAWGDTIGIGTETIARWIDEAAQNPSVKAVVLEINSGGGYGLAVNVLAEAIQNCQAAGKTVNAYVRMAGSAAYYIASYCDSIVAAGANSYIGCIGSMVTLQDISVLLKGMGIKIVEVYAPQSTDKNQEMIQALAGKEGLLKENILHPDAQLFIDTVAKNRPSVNKEALKGAMKLGKAGLDNGLIDGIMNFRELINQVMGDGVPKATAMPTQKPKTTTMELKLLLAGNLAFAGIETQNATGVDKADDVLLRELSQHYAGLSSENAILKQEKVTLSKEKADLVTLKESLTTQLSTKTTEFDALKTKYDALPGATRSAARSDGATPEHIEGDGEEISAELKAAREAEKETLNEYSHY